MNEKERACITQSHEAHRVSARRRLTDFIQDISFEPLNGAYRVKIATRCSQ